MNLHPKEGDGDDKRVRKWRENFCRIMGFMTRTGRFPRGGDGEEEEDADAKWLEKQFQNYKKKTGSMVHPNVCMWFSFFIKNSHLFQSGSQDDRDQQEWRRMMTELEAFVEKNQVRPRVKSRDKTEQKIARWTVLQLRLFRGGHMRDDRRSILQTFLEKHHDIVRVLRHAWFQKFAQVQAFLEEHKRRPSSSSENVEERKLGQWLYYQYHFNYQNKTGVLREDKVRQMFHDFMQKNHVFAHRMRIKSTSPHFLEHVRERLDKIQNFIDINDRKPYLSSKDPSEKQLATWLRYCLRLRNHELAAGMVHEFLQLNLLQASSSRYAAWKKRLEELKKFVADHHYLPRDDNPEEKPLRLWWKDQQQMLRRRERIMADDKVRHEFQQTTAGMFSRASWMRWRFRFDELEKFCKENECRPSAKSPHEQERRLGMWVSRHLTMLRHSRGIMRQACIRDQFQNFMDAHPAIF